MKKSIGFRLAWGAVTLVSLIPLRILYIISDFLAWLAHSVVGYRRRVVRENLTSSFPEKPEEEIRRIEKGFYRFLADYFFETLKMATMSEATMRCRMRIKGIEQINEAVREGRNVSLVLGHYCNWEWVSSMPLEFDPVAIGMQVYHPLENKIADEIFYRLRERFRSHNVSMSEVLPTLIRYKREERPTVTGYIADQAPGFGVHLFVDFLNHDTGVYTGPERISKFLNAEVYFLHLSRPRRGYYKMKIVKITGNARKERDFDISRKYFELLEQNIREAPQYWLWSHRRWKRTRAMFEDYYGKEKAAEQLSHL